MNENARIENVAISPVPREDALQHDNWYPMLDESSCKHALEMVQLIVERMRDPENIIAITEVAKTQTAYVYQWSDPSFACGFGSLVLPYLYLARSFPGQGWEDMARFYMRLAASGTHQKPFLSASVFGGSSGLATVVNLMCRDDARYQKTCTTFNREIAAQVLGQSWRREEPGVADRTYDAIGGAAGILGYLISTGSKETMVEDAIQKLLEYLTWLGNNEDELGHKKWFIPPELFPLPHFREQYPDGYFNVGLAHGIPGPLAALSLAWQTGYQVEGQREAIKSISQWVLEHQVFDQWGINWPGGIPLKDSFSALEWLKLSAARAGWCYGAPGVARSLWLAGNVLDDKHLCQIAIDGIETVLRRPIDVRNIDSPTLCHGVGGLLSICLRFAHEVESPLIHQHIPLLVNQILEMCSSDYPLGVRNEETRGKFVDDPGFLTGAAGVALVLLAASTSVKPDWDRTLLIA